MPSLPLRVVLLAAALAVVGCADSDPPGPTLDGTDPVQSDGDLAPDADLEPGPDLAPESELAPESGNPAQTLQPDSSAGS